MPGLVHAAQLDDAAYPLDQLASEITRRVMTSQAAHKNVELNSYVATESAPR